MGFSKNDLLSFCKDCFEKNGGKDFAIKKMQEIGEAVKEVSRDKIDNTVDLAAKGQTEEQIKAENNKKEQSDMDER